jgi:hypothetical protein
LKKVLDISTFGGLFGTVHGLLFKKKGLIPAGNKPFVQEKFADIYP